MASIWWASLATNSAVSILLQILLICGCVAGVFTAWGFIASAELSRMFGMPTPYVWWAQLGTVLQSIMVVLLLYSLTVAQCTFEAANRSTLPRLVFLAFVLWHFMWLVIDWLGGGTALDGDSIAVTGAALSPVVYLAGLFAVTENQPVSTRVRRQIPANPVGQLFAAFFFPGAGRGWLYLLLLEFCIGIVPGVVAAASGSEYWPLPLWFAGFNIVYLGLGASFARAVGKKSGRAVRRWLALLAMGVLVVIPLIIAAILSVLDTSAADYIGSFNPFYLLGVEAWEMSGPAGGAHATAGLCATVWLVLLTPAALLINATTIVRDLVEQAAAGRENAYLRWQRRSVAASPPATPANPQAGG
jgi:hypothetical protein